MEDKWTPLTKAKIHRANMKEAVLLVKPSLQEEQSYDVVWAKQKHREPGKAEKYAYYEGKVYGVQDPKQLQWDDMMGVGYEGKMAFPKFIAHNQDTKDWATDLNQNELLLVMEDKGIAADKIIYHKDLLKDFNSPVVYHQQTEFEKDIWLSRLSSMKPGDELIYSIRRDIDEQPARKPELETYRYACVEKGIILPFKLEKANQVKENSDAHEDRLYAERFAYKGKLLHWEHSWIGSETISLDHVRDIKINKGRFTEEEIGLLKEGKPLDYNKVYARKEIPDMEEYMAYKMAMSKGENENSITAWKGEIVSPGIGKSQPKEAKKEILETKKHASPQLSEALKVLRQVAKEVSHEGKNGQQIARTMNEVADHLARGNGLEIATRKTRREAFAKQWVFPISKNLENRFPEIDKGLEKIIPQRDQKDREEFYKKHPRRKGIQPLKSNQSLER